MPPLLEVCHLSKHYSLRRGSQAQGNILKAVDDISFAIPAGICFGLLGPNGAGKTTTIEMMEGISKPTGGEIYYRGALRRHGDKGSRFLQEAGIQFQKTALMDFLTVRETLELFASFYPQHAAIDHLIDICHLGEFLEHYANKLSGGQQQRLLLALALVNNPEIVFLDEPTTGLDPQARHNFWQLIDNIKKQGKTIILTTHYMEEAESLCDTLIIIDHGKIIVEGKPADLLKQHFNGACITLPRNAAVQLNILRETHPALDFQIKDNQVEIFTDSIEKTITLLIDKGISLDSLSVRSPSLEDLFLKLTGHSLRS
jgi:ABC-2 type transport system ATP-binding protein